MGYRVITVELIYEVFRRWHSGQKITRISKTEGLDRKTVGQYIEKLQQKGFTRENSFPERNELCRAIAEIIPERQRRKTGFEKLIPFEEEIRSMVHDSSEPVLPKTAYEIIVTRYCLDVSYATYKRFLKEKRISSKPFKGMIRIELPPGFETQIDYGRAGLLDDPASGRSRVVYAYCGILSCSRLPFIQFVFSQDQQSFTSSTIDMFEFYGGATEIISIDNLKSGVIKPDLWDPKINKCFSEMAEHYGVFIDPCRVATPTDKGKVERLVPSARELFRKLKKLHPTADIHELNEMSVRWCKDEYGMREHGTTREIPVDVFEHHEKPMLKSLPADRFEVPRWKEVKVHPDQFFEYDKKRYSLPAKYCRKRVWVRQNGHILRVFHEHTLIREYVITRQRVNHISEDFPETVREMINGGYPQYLINEAKKYGDIPARLIERVLKPHAYLNARRAQAMLRVMEKFCDKSYFVDVCQNALDRKVRVPQTFMKMLDHEDGQLSIENFIQSSEEGKSMVRDISEFIN
jgi:transposase